MNKWEAVKRETRHCFVLLSAKPSRIKEHKVCLVQLEFVSSPFFTFLLLLKLWLQVDEVEEV